MSLSGLEPELKLEIPGDLKSDSFAVVPGLSLPADTAARHLAFVGMSGSGKTISAKVVADPPVKQVRASEAWASALGWWARTRPGEPVEMGALMRRSGLIRSTAYAYLREYRQNGFVDANNVPVAGHLQP